MSLYLLNVTGTLTISLSHLDESFSIKEVDHGYRWIDLEANDFLRSLPKESTEVRIQISAALKGETMDCSELQDYVMLSCQSLQQDHSTVSSSRLPLVTFLVTRTYTYHFGRKRSLGNELIF